MSNPNTHANLTDKQIKDLAEKIRSSKAIRHLLGSIFEAVSEEMSKHEEEKPEATDEELDTRIGNVDLVTTEMFRQIGNNEQ